MARISAQITKVENLTTTGAYKCKPFILYFTLKALVLGYFTHIVWRERDAIIAKTLQCCKVIFWGGVFVDIAFVNLKPGLHVRRKCKRKEIHIWTGFNASTIVNPSAEAIFLFLAFAFARTFLFQTCEQRKRKRKVKKHTDSIVSMPLLLSAWLSTNRSSTILKEDLNCACVSYFPSLRFHWTCELRLRLHLRRTWWTTGPALESLNVYGKLTQGRRRRQRDIVI